MSRPVPQSVPRGLRLFVVEDEAIVAMAMEGMLTDLGCIVVGAIERCDPKISIRSLM